MPSELQERAETGAEIIIRQNGIGLPTPPSGYILVDLGRWVELRQESPDPSVPTGGSLVAFAHADGAMWVNYWRTSGNEVYAERWDSKYRSALDMIVDFFRDND